MNIKILYILFFLLLISCSANKHHFQLKQEECGNCLVEVTFFKKKDTISEGNIILIKKIKLENAQMKRVKVKINYFHKENLSEASTPVFFDKKSKKYQIFGENDQLHTISLYPFENKNFFYQAWLDVYPINFFEQHTNLKQYIHLAKPMSWQTSNGTIQEDKNTLIYEEPFSEFKRKNPELLEFLTKGDTIELEVISPVKQKYRFPAEW